MSAFEICVFRKANGPLSKHIGLKDGKPDPDGSACRMAAGTARRVKLNDIGTFAKLIGDMKSNEAPTLGRLRADLPDSVKVITKKELSGSTPPNVIARTADYLQFAEREPALCLLDHDGKEMPNEIADKLKQLGGFWPAVIAVAANLIGAARVSRRSTSAGLLRRDTRERFTGSANSHEYIAVADGSDIKRALQTLHDRLWLAGLGYYVVGAIGQLLDRSIIDASVYGPERLVFEGAPVLVPPLAQDAAVRRPQVHDGQVIDTVQAIPTLTEEEARRLAALKAEAARRLKPAAVAARKAWAVEFAARRGLTQADAERIAAAASDKQILAPEFELEFDELGSCTVADVLADPDRYVGEALADPLEGTDYGRGKAMVLRRHDGTLMINSYAHGGVKYRLEGQGVTLDDFNSYMEKASTYIYTPTRAMWPGSRVNARVPPVPLLDHDGNPLLDDKGNPRCIPATVWLDRHRPVEQMTWAPGYPTLILDQLMDNAGWFRRNGVNVFNQYRPPILALGDADSAGPWLDHVRKVYPDDADHIIKFFAHRVQKPHEKINHALVLGGEQGIGKDTIVEPVTRAVGPWNVEEVSPQTILGTDNNGYVKSVILRISEVRDLGEFDRFKFYDHMKAIITTPPIVLRVNEKYINEYYVPNVCAVVITTNYKSNGMYLPADDRRHYVTWSELKKECFAKDYWNEIWRWYNSGGDTHVAAYLMQLDLAAFDAMAEPPKSPTWFAIVDANRAPEDAELADILDALGKPKAVTLEQIRRQAEGETLAWLCDRDNRRIIPHRMESCGYVRVRNPADKNDGHWKVGGKRQVVYAKKEMALAEQLAAATEVAAAGVDGGDRTSGRMEQARRSVAQIRSWRASR